MSLLQSKPEWEFWYWPLKNRGNFIQLLFAECGVPYKSVTEMELVQNKIRSNYFGKLKKTNDIIYQAMAPPFIIHNKGNSNKPIIMSQTEHCVGYISERIGLRPNKIEDHYRAQMIVGHCNELFLNIFNLAGPLTLNTDKNMVKEFINNRLKIWLDILQKPLRIKKDQLFYFGDQISQADLAVFNILNGLNELFNDKIFKLMIGENYPILFNHYYRIGNRKQIKDLMEKQKMQNIPWFPKQILGFNANFHIFTTVVNEMYLKKSKL